LSYQVAAGGGVFIDEIRITRPATASCEPIEVEFAGTIDTIDAPGRVSEVGLGTPFSGRLILDPDAAVLNGSQSVPPTFAFYDFSPSIGLLEGSIGTTPFSENVVSIFVSNDDFGFLFGIPDGSDGWSTFSALQNPIPTLVSGNHDAILEFFDFSGAKLDNTDFFVNTELAGWNDLAHLRVFDGSTPILSGTITNLTVVPEPAIGPTILTGVAALLLLARRREVNAQSAERVRRVSRSGDR
jgi:hypothetical protein